MMDSLGGERILTKRNDCSIIRTILGGKLTLCYEKFKLNFMNTLYAPNCVIGWVGTNLEV